MATNLRQYTDATHLPVGRKTTVFCAATESGKTVLAFHTLQLLQCRAEPAFAKVFVLSPTAHVQEIWDHMPTSDVFNNPEEFAGVMAGILHHQEFKVSRTGRLPILVIVDDCVGRLKGEAGSEFVSQITQLSSAGRHLDIAVWILTQTPQDGKTMNPTVRSMAHCKIFGIIDGDHRLAVEGKLMGLDKKSAKVLTTTAWSEPYRFVAVDSSPGCGSDRHTLIKVDMKKVVKFGMKYRVPK